MVTTVCRAKNPATCRYHGQEGQEYINQQLSRATKLYNNVEKTCVALLKQGHRNSSYTEEFLRIKEILESAKLDYYATPEGSAKLDEEIANATDLNKIMELESIKHFAEQRVNDEENGKVVPQTIIPGAAKIFIFPDFDRIKEEGSTTVWEGNKYIEQASSSNIKNLLKRDIEQAAEIGYLPKGLNIDATSKAGRLPSVNLIVKAPASFTAEQKNQLRNVIGKMAKAYAKAVVTINEDGTKQTDSSFTLFLNVD